MPERKTSEYVPDDLVPKSGSMGKMGKPVFQIWTIYYSLMTHWARAMKFAHSKDLSKCSIHSYLCQEVGNYEPLDGVPLYVVEALC